MTTKNQMLAVLACFVGVLAVGSAQRLANLPDPAQGCASCADPLTNPKCKNCTSGGLVPSLYSWANVYCAFNHWPEYDILWTYTIETMNCSNGTGYYCANHSEVDPPNCTMPQSWWTCPSGTCAYPQP
jgi:hypothetical protein